MALRIAQKNRKNNLPIVQHTYENITFVLTILPALTRTSTPCSRLYLHSTTLCARWSSFVLPPICASLKLNINTLQSPSRSIISHVDACYRLSYNVIKITSTRLIWLLFNKRQPSKLHRKFQTLTSTQAFSKLHRKFQLFFLKIHINHRIT